MIRLLRRSAIGIGLALAAFSAGVIVFIGPVEQAIKRRIEIRLGYIFQSEATVGRLRIQPWRRGAEIEDLVVENPPGFRRGAALHFRHIAFSFELATFFSSMPVLDKVEVAGLEVYLRHEAGQGVNLAALARSARGAAESLAAGREGERKILVRRLQSTAGTVHLSSNLLPLGQVPMRLADFTLRDIGSDAPVTTAEFASIVTRSLLWEVLSLKGLLRPLATTLQDEFDRLMDKAGRPLH